MSTLYFLLDDNFTRDKFQQLRFFAALIAVAFAICLCALPVFPQANQGTMQGGVFDQTGGAIAGATVTVIDVARGVSRTLTADATGQYVAPNLTPGTYTVRAVAKGFRTIEHSGVLVEVGQTIRVDLTLQPGEQTQTVTVTGELPPIDTTDSTLGGIVSNNAINSLPLNGRNFDRLLQLRPGVVTSVGSGAGSNESTNGMRVGDDIVLLEGINTISQSGQTTSVINSTYRFGDSGSLLPIDSIQEFNTEQDPKAEYGWKAGSVVTVGVKSGTNSLHGTAYAFGRDAAATDAANYFSTPGLSAVTPAAVEQFGASAGGRIIKDKLFWFANYEGLRATLGDVAVDTIPTELPGLGASKSIVDACNALGRGSISPLSAQISGLPAGSCTPQSASSTFENLFPFNTAQSTSFAPGLISTGPLDNGIFKADYVINSHQHVNGMYYVSKSSQLNNYASGQLTPEWEANVLQDVHMYAGDWTWTPSSNWVNDFRIGYVYLDDETLPADISHIASDPWPSGYGINTGVTNPLYGGMPEIKIGGFSGYLGAGQRTSIRGPEGNVDFVETASYLHGNHSFKFGFEYLDLVFDGDSFSQAQGEVSFKSLTTFLQGIPNSATILLGNPNMQVRGHWFAGFAQDDWRLTTRFTLNLGLRYEYYGPPVERNNYEGNFNPNVNPVTTPAVEQVGPGEPIPSMYNPYYKGFAPRLGMAWDVRGNGKTVVRAGVSVLRDPASLTDIVPTIPFGANFPSINVNNSGTQASMHTPVQPSLSGCGTPTCANGLNWTLAGPVFPGNSAQVINGVTYTGITCTPTSPCATGATIQNLQEPYVVAWNLDVQRAITNNLSVDLAYVGNHSFNQEITEDLNQPAIGAGWAGAPTTNCLASAPLYTNCAANTAAQVGAYTSQFPYLSYITAATNGDYSNYDAMQLTVNERTSHGLSFLAGYTYSHALAAFDSGSTSAILPTDNSNLALNYGNTNTDLRHRFTFSPTYAIPGMKSPGQMLEGWTAAGILTLQSGLPWYANDQTNDFLGTGEFNNSTDAKGGFQPWDYTGPASAFTSGPTSIPCYTAVSKGSPILPGCTPYSTVGGVPTPPTACLSAAQANGQLAVASLMNFGCYVQNGGVLTPPAFGSIGTAASQNMFRAPAYYNLDFSISKVWKVGERYTAQFRVEFFNLLNTANFVVPAATDPSVGSSGQFGCSCSTPDVSNPVFGSGGPRHIQFGLKLAF